MATASTTDKRVGFPLVLGILAMLGAVGMTVFGFTGAQLAAGASFAVAMLAGSLAVAAYHVYD
jgi:hypothetical protein